MKRQIESRLIPPTIICLAPLLLLLIAPTSSTAQTELRADRQILLEAKHGAVAIRQGPDDRLFVLVRSVPSALWSADYSGSSVRQVLNGGPEPAQVRFPKDFTVDRDGNAIIIDGLIKVFSRDGKLLSSFPFERPESVGVLSDGRILVSGFPKDNLMFVFDKQGRSVGGIGIPAKIEEGLLNAFQNVGTIVVDTEDNIYYVFRYALTPMVRKYKSDGTLTAEWYLDTGAIPQRTLAAAKAKYQENKKSGAYGGIRLLTAAAFDEESKTLWVASGSRVLQLDGSGGTIRSFDLVRPDGGPIQADGLLVDRNFIRVAGTLHGAFEYLKPH